MFEKKILFFGEDPAAKTARYPPPVPMAPDAKACDRWTRHSDGFTALRDVLIMLFSVLGWKLPQRHDAVAQAMVRGE